MKLRNLYPLAVNLFYFWMFLATSVFSPTWANKLCPAMITKLSGSEGASLRSEVKQKESEAQTAKRDAESHTTSVSDAERKLSAAQAQVDSMWNQMNWRERNIRGFLGGRRNVVAEHDALVKTRNSSSAELEKSRSNLKKAEKKAEDLDQKVHSAVATWLEQSDKSFQELTALEKSLDDLVACGKKCLSKIDSASKEVSDAEDWELFDAVSTNKGLSVLSYMETEEAADEIEGARKAINSYKKKLDKFQSQIKSLGETDIDDTFDLVLDLAFDFSFDFTSWLNMFALSDAADSLDQARGRIKNVHKKFVADATALKKELHEIVCEARGICAESHP